MSNLDVAYEKHGLIKIRYSKENLKVKLKYKLFHQARKKNNTSAILHLCVLE